MTEPNTEWIDGFLKTELDEPNAEEPADEVPDEPDDGALSAPQSGGASPTPQSEVDRHHQLVAQLVTERGEPRALLDWMRSDSSFLDGILPRLDAETGQWSREERRPPHVENPNGPRNFKR